MDATVWAIDGTVNCANLEDGRPALTETPADTTEVAAILTEEGKLTGTAPGKSGVSGVSGVGIGITGNGSVAGGETAPTGTCTSGIDERGSAEVAFGRLTDLVDALVGAGETAAPEASPESVFATSTF